MAVRPAWSAHIPRFGLYLPLHAGGYVLLLAGFLAMIHDWVRAQAGVRQSAEKDRRRADDAQLHEAQLRRERDFIRGILETGELAIMGLDLADGTLTLFNRGAELVTGYARQEVLGRPYADALLLPEDREQARRGLADGRAGLTPPGRAAAAHDRHQDGRAPDRGLDVLGLARRRRPARDLVAFGRDVTAERRMQARLDQARTELQQANVELARLAATDSLTGLVNRRQADILLEREAARPGQSSPTGVIMMDIDHFKDINDTHGHKVGDAVLAGRGPAAPGPRPRQRRCGPLRRRGTPPDPARHRPGGRRQPGRDAPRESRGRPLCTRRVRGPADRQFRRGRHPTRRRRDRRPGHPDGRQGDVRRQKPRPQPGRHLARDRANPSAAAPANDATRPGRSPPGVCPSGRWRPSRWRPGRPSPRRPARRPPTRR